MAARRRRKPGSRPTGGGGARHPNSLANLQPGAGAWRPGQAPALKHGARSRNPPPLIIGAIVDEIEEALAEQAPVRGPDGGLPAQDVYMVRLAAIALLRVRRVTYYCLLQEGKDPGGLPAEFETWGKCVEQAARMLERLGLGPAARMKLGVDIARTVDLSMAMSEKDPALRRQLLAAAGVVDGEVVDG